MRDSYDFSNAKPNPFAERLRKEGFRITVRNQDGSVSERDFPPGTRPARGKTVHVYAVRNRWVVRTAGASRAYRQTLSEEEALAIGRALARRTCADLVVHSLQP